MDEEASGSVPAFVPGHDEGKSTTGLGPSNPKPSTLDPTPAPSVDVLKRELLESKRSWRLIWMLACFTAAYIFIIWASLYSPTMLLLALILLPFLPFRWWEAILLLLSVILIFSACHWDDVHTGMRLYRDAREGHWV